MLMEAGMRNGEVARAMCEQHSKDVIFAAAIQAISLVLAGMKNPSQSQMDLAMNLMQQILDINGLEIAAIIAAENQKA